MGTSAGTGDGRHGAPWGPPATSPVSAGSSPTADGPRRRHTTVIVAALLAVVALVVGLAVVGGDGIGDPTGQQPAGDVGTTVAPPSTVAVPETTQPAVTGPPATASATTTLPPTTTTDPGFVQGDGEIFLETSGSEGPDPFAGEVFGGEPWADESTPPPEPAESAGPTEVASVSGATPGIYGGTRDNAVCDKAAQLRFLENHRKRAKAFVKALNSDPNLMWSGGDELTVAQLPEYFAELTPIVLTSDTRVTNHGYREGRPTSRQVVLQAGTAVLVDAYGVPRARCLCRNPLTTPRPVQTAPVYTGVSWVDFDPVTIVVVEQTTVVIEVYVLVDLATGEWFVRPAGSDGTIDTWRQASTWRIEVNATLAEVDYFNMTTATWRGELTIAPDGTLAGTGAGTWTFDADCYEQGGAIQSTSSAAGSFVVTLSGQTFTTELGRFATIEPTYSGFNVDSYAGTPPVAVCEQDIYDHVESWVSPSFTTIELAAEGDVVFASYESNRFVGDVTLTPIG